VAPVRLGKELDSELELQMASIGSGLWRSPSSSAITSPESSPITEHQLKSADRHPSTGSRRSTSRSGTARSHSRSPRARSTSEATLSTLNKELCEQQRLLLEMPRKERKEGMQAIEAIEQQIQMEAHFARMEASQGDPWRWDGSCTWNSFQTGRLEAADAEVQREAAAQNLSMAQKEVLRQQRLRKAKQRLHAMRRNSASEVIVTQPAARPAPPKLRTAMTPRERVEEEALRSVSPLRSIARGDGLDSTAPLRQEFRALIRSQKQKHCGAGHPLPCSTSPGHVRGRSPHRRASPTSPSQHDNLLRQANERLGSPVQATVTVGMQADALLACQHQQATIFQRRHGGDEVAQDVAGHEVPSLDANSQREVWLLARAAASGVNVPTSRSKLV